MLKTGQVKISHRPMNLVETDIYGKSCDNILHICHREWWGIRSATEMLPGYKLHISAYDSFDFQEIINVISSRGMTEIIFQGYSSNASDLAEAIHAKIGDAVRLSVVTHVAVSQFDNQFEIDMIATMVHQKRRGVIARLLSVKPGFDQVCDSFLPHLLINTLPAWIGDGLDHEPGAALIPLTRGLRKNMQANHIALCRSSYEVIYSTLDNADLRGIVNDEKVHYLGHIPQSAVSQIMSAVGLVTNVTLTECQPMALNEAVAHGTPCLTGPLFLPFCAGHPLRKITEVPDPNDIGLIKTYAERIRDMWVADAQAMVDICRDYHQQVTRLSAESYAQIFGN